MIFFLYSLMKSRGIDVGTTTFLIKVRPFEGQKFKFNSTAAKKDVQIHLEKRVKMLNYTKRRRIYYNLNVNFLI